MDIICTGCNRHYKIAEEKLPSSKVASFTCPNCKKRIKIEVPSSKIAVSIGEKTCVNDLQGFESFEPGTKTALIYCPETELKKQLQKVLGFLGYEVRFINKQNDIMSRFRYHIYDFILLYQNGLKAEDDLTNIQEYINSLFIDIRRKIFVAHVHPEGNRLDSLQAFSMGADLTLSPSDIKNLSQILPSALETQKMGYKVFFECKSKVEEEIF
ncbi:MAG: hypothetical protein AVO38_09720 [delta proteobacterium ML8_D]|nr:MAG: hypothetical protein AVO38_09720 [delta proteobacterium ML8_D]